MAFWQLKKVNNKIYDEYFCVLFTVYSYNNHIGIPNNKYLSQYKLGIINNCHIKSIIVKAYFMRYDTSEDITYELDINIILCLDIRDSIISNSEHLQMYLSHKICL